MGRGNIFVSTGLFRLIRGPTGIMVRPICYQGMVKVRFLVVSLWGNWVVKCQVDFMVVCYVFMSFGSTIVILVIQFGLTRGRRGQLTLVAVVGMFGHGIVCFIYSMSFRVCFYTIFVGGVTIVSVKDGFGTVHHAPMLVTTLALTQGDNTFTIGSSS